MSQRFVEVVTSRKIITRGLLWYIMFYFIVRTSVFTLDCSDIKGCICEDTNSEEDYVALYCESQNNSYFLIEIIIPRWFTSIPQIQIHCINSPKWVDVHVKVNLFEFSRLKQVDFIDCDIPPSTISLHEITQMLGVTNAKALRFINSKNSKLMKHHLNGLGNFRELDFTSSMTFCDRNLLANLPNLTTFQLIRNNISFIPAAFFNHTARLERLVLSENNLQSIEPGMFDNLKFLKELYINGNNFTKFPLGIFDQLTALEHLSTGKNNLISLSENIFAKLANLETIDLNYNYFTELPKDLFRNNIKLQKIRIMYNQVLATSPREFFSNFTLLSELGVFSNGLATLPEDLFWGLFSLAEISLSKNQLKSLPRNILRDAKQLILLELDMNKLEELPEYIFKNTKKLQILNLSQNRISSISGNTFYNIGQLRELNMENNILTTISASTFMPTTYIVRFSHNHLTLQSLKNLTSLFTGFDKIYLDHNNISGTLNLEILKGLSFYELDMKYNKISALNLTYVGFLTNHIQINLTYNKIKHIHLIEDELVRQFGDKQNIVNILVDNNPITCDCSLYNYLRYTDGRMHLVTNSFLNIRPRNLSCHSPKRLKNVKVTDLRSNTLECKTQDTNLNIPCARECDCILRPEDKEWRIECSGKNLIQVPRDVMDPGKPYKLGLNFSGNMLKKMPNLAEMNLQSARLLDLSYNSISEVSKNALPDLIEVLKLDNNNISRIHSDVLELLKKSTNLPMLTLHGNPWEPT